VLVAVLAPVASVPAALAVAVLSRLVRTAADLGTAGLSFATLGRARLGAATTPVPVGQASYRQKRPCRGRFCR
jgi:hypothetical protein